MGNYRICTRCVMDTTDPDIQFDENGICNHCQQYDDMVREQVFSGEEGRRQLSKIIDEIKRNGAGKKYDCIIGVSGGVDSTFAAYQVKELGLRPLAVHLDNGWDSELAVDNIHKTLQKLDIDLYTYVIDWEEFKDLQISFLKASTPDSEIPSDHAIVSLMYQMVAKTNVKYAITGRNIRTETHVPLAWSRGHSDWKYIRSVHRQFGQTPLKTYPHRSFWAELWYRRTQRWINILDYLDYVKKDAIQILEQELDWRYYGGKHYESIYTRFYQGYILPRKFGYDKRRAHLSSLICSGEITREQALQELENEPYSPEMQAEDKVYVIKKLGLTDKEFEEIMALPPKTILDYPSYARDFQRPAYRTIRRLYRVFGKGIKPFADSIKIRRGR